MIYLFLVFLILTVVVSVRNYLSGKRLLRDYIYYWKLHSKSLTSWDTFCRQNPSKSDIIISLSTIPSRIDQLGPTLKSLLCQKMAAAKICIFLPRYSEREQCNYTVPPFLKQLGSVKIVEIEKDWGPASKFIPAVLTSDSQQKIIVVDDDNIYPPGMIEDFAHAAERDPESIFALSGWRVPADLVDRPTTLKSNLLKIAPTPVPSTRISKPYEVDIIQGYSGYLIKPAFFDTEKLTDYTGTPAAARFVDDVWISAHAKARKFVVPTSRFCFTLFWKHKFYKSTSLAKINNWGRSDDKERNNSIMLAFFREKWHRNVAPPN